jgi:hypothetical protein
LFATGSLMAGEVMPAKQPVVYTAPPQSDWEFDFLLYGWAAGLNGTFGVNGLTSAVDLGVDDTLNNLNMVASGTFSVR